MMRLFHWLIQSTFQHISLRSSWITISEGLPSGQLIYAPVACPFLCLSLQCSFLAQRQLPYVYIVTWWSVSGGNEGLSDTFQTQNTVVIPWYFGIVTFLRERKLYKTTVIKSMMPTSNPGTTVVKLPW